MATDSSNDVYAAGIFSGTADFDPGSGVYDLTPVGGQDGFLVKLSPIGRVPTLSSWGVVWLAGLLAISTLGILIRKDVRRVSDGPVRAADLGP